MEKNWAKKAGATYLTLGQGERAAVAGAVASRRHIPAAPTVQTTPAAHSYLRYKVRGPQGSLTSYYLLHIYIYI